MLLNIETLRRHLRGGRNVLFEGLHGVGKTHIVTSLFEEEKLKWKYFSAPTLDPWVDFVGVPKAVEVTGRETSHELQLIRPTWVLNEDIEAIFIDEFNRAPPKILNAVMELIQFKSINGFKMPKLKVIWAAINPDDEDSTYMVGKIDPAQLDRFHVKVTVPYKVDEEYFVKKYPETGKIWVQWWMNLPEEAKKKISPRRLDFAAEGYHDSCRIEDFIYDKGINCSELRKLLRTVPFHNKLADISTKEEAEVFLSDINNVTLLVDFVKKKDSKSVTFFGEYKDLIPGEFLDATNGIKIANSNIVPENLLQVIQNVPLNADGQGNRQTGMYINKINLERMYDKKVNPSASTMSADLKMINKVDQDLLRDFAAHLCEVIMNCGNADAVSELMWGSQSIGGKKSPTNLQVLMIQISVNNGDLYRADQKKAVNSILFENKIVTGVNFL